MNNNPACFSRETVQNNKLNGKKKNKKIIAKACLMSDGATLMNL